MLRCPGNNTRSGPSYGPLTLRRSGTSVSVAGRGSEARVVITNLPAGEGLVHVVDSVLLPFYTDVLQASGAPRSIPPDVLLAFSQRVPAASIRNVDGSAAALTLCRQVQHAHLCGPAGPVCRRHRLWSATPTSAR